MSKWIPVVKRLPGLEQGATIRDLEERLNLATMVKEEESEVTIEKIAHLRAQLSAEQAAHAATMEELRKADEALVEAHENLNWFQKLFPCDGSVPCPFCASKKFQEDMEGAHKAALARQTQRAHSDAAKEE